MAIRTIAAGFLATLAFHPVTSTAGEAGFKQKGVASYYADRFHGRKTASGEIYNQKKMTAAHESLPFGTLVKVENLANTLSVIVKVNDRCRRHEQVIIDVSREAALELGFVRHGTARVRMSVVGNNPPDQVATTARD